MHWTEADVSFVALLKCQNRKTFEAFKALQVMTDESETLKNLQGEPERKQKREATSQMKEESNASLIAEMQDGDDSESLLASSC